MKGNKKITFGVLFFLAIPLLAQKDKNKEYPTEEKIEGVVMTGQISPQSVKKSIKNVRVITPVDIKNLGATTLDGVLNQYINMTVETNPDTGATGISMFGLDSGYFKILIDNVPLVNEKGVGNNIDLSQININDIEQIEIIEGAMGVTHGANAVTGILNIITKKHFRNQWEIKTSIQEETNGKEYDYLDKGKHIQNFSIGRRLGKAFNLQLGVNRNATGGFLGDVYQGKNSLENRGYKFLPREMFQTQGMLNYRSQNLKAFYKFEYMNHLTHSFGRNLSDMFNLERGWGSYKKADDKRYSVTRFYNLLNANGKIFKKVDFNFSLSHQKQRRDTENFAYNVNRGIEFNHQKNKDQEMDVIYSLGTFSNLLPSEKINLQMGYEVVLNKGFSREIGEGRTIKEINKSINNYDIFAVSEVKLSEKFSLRPGFRYSFQSLFENQYSYSFGTRYLHNKNWESRASVGQSYRTPTFTELYLKEIFNQYSFVGNENLIPEKSFSFEGSLRKITNFSNQSMLSNQVMVSFHDIKDKINMVLKEDPERRISYEYMNINKYQAINFSSTNQFKYGNWNANLGASLSLVSQRVTDREFTIDDKFLTNLSFNTNLSYLIPKWDLNLSVYYKMVLRSQRWNSSPSTGYYIAELDPYGWLDFSLGKTFLDKNLELMFGVKNLLGTTDVIQTNRLNTGVQTRSLELSSGRSFFLKIAYNLYQ